MRLILACLLIAGLAGCAIPFVRAPSSDYSANDGHWEREKAAEAEQREKAAAEAAEEARIEKQKIDADYRAYLRTGNVCDTKNWSRYEFGQYFSSLAERNKITPYDVVKGSDYARRNISGSVLTEALANYLKYLLYQMAEPLRAKYSEDDAPEDLKRKVFNASIARDYECYKKLK